MSDACTWWPDTVYGYDLSGCCLAHDAAYAGDGLRMAVDFELARCVAETTGMGWLALVMFTGVALFGWAFRRRKPRSAIRPPS